MRYLGKFNETCFISCQRHFILLSGIFHSLPCIHFISISYLALGYFITTQADFSLFISFLAWGYFITTQSNFSFFIFHFIPCLGLFHNHPVRFFIVHFILCPGLFHNQPVHFFISCPRLFHTTLLDFSLFISFLAWDNFIPPRWISIPAARDFIYFISCLGRFHTHLDAFFIACLA